MQSATGMIEEIRQTGPKTEARTCRHSTPEGAPCGSPALRGEKFCYYHHAARPPVASLRERRARQNRFSLPDLQSPDEIQYALGRVLQNVAANNIDLRRAGLLLYGLQIATTNLSRTQQHNQSTQTHPQTSAANTSAQKLSNSPHDSTPCNPTSFPSPEAPPNSNSLPDSTSVADFTDTVTLRRPVFNAIMEGLARHRGDLPPVLHEPSPDESRDDHPDLAPLPHILPNLSAEADPNLRPSSPALGMDTKAVIRRSSGRCRLTLRRKQASVGSHSEVLRDSSMRPGEEKEEGRRRAWARVDILWRTRRGKGSEGIDFENTGNFTGDREPAVLFLSDNDLSRATCAGSGSGAGAAVTTPADRPTN